MSLAGPHENVASGATSSGFPREQRLVDDQEIGLVRVRLGWLRYSDTRRVQSAGAIADPPG